MPLRVLLPLGFSQLIPDHPRLVLEVDYLPGLALLLARRLGVHIHFLELVRAAFRRVDCQRHLCGEEVLDLRVMQEAYYE